MANDIKAFMKEFNNSVSMLKEDIKNSDKNKDYLIRLEYIRNLINKELDSNSSDLDEKTSE